MSARIGLMVVQAVGALSIVPYPAILVANVMAMASEGQTFRGALPFALLSLYPLIWLGLDRWGWILLGRGECTWAFGVSSVPVALGLAGALFAYGQISSEGKREAAKGSTEEAAVRGANPLAWTMLCYYGPPRYKGVTPVTLEAVLQEIGQSGQANTPVAGHGTPLGIALQNFQVPWDWDGVTGDARLRGSRQIVRALVARGAQMRAEENSSLLNRCRLNLALMDGRNETESENALVWAIVKGTLTGADPFTLTAAQRALLNVPTRIYGTPLAASQLLPNSGYLGAQLIAAGARLSKKEARDPAVMGAVEHFVFREYPRAKEQYEQ